MSTNASPSSSSATGMAPQPALLKLARRIVLGSCYGLVLYFLATSLRAVNGLSLGALVIWLIQIIPLAIFLPSLHGDRLRSYAWVSFVVLLYFIHGVLVAFEPERRLYGFVEVGLCALLFTGLIIYIRQYRDHYGVGLQ